MTQDISALMDGELEAGQASTVIARVTRNPELQEEWAIYHLIGDAIRHSVGYPMDLTRRVSEKLEAEPAALAPRRSPPRSSARVYALSAAASVAAVAMVAWVVLQSAPDVNQPVIAQPQTAPAAMPIAALVTAPAAAPRAANAPNSRLPSAVGEYLMAHQEYSPSTQIQGVAPYIRTVSDPSRDFPR